MSDIQRRIQELTAVLRDTDEMIAKVREDLRALKQHRADTENTLSELKANAKSDATKEAEVQGILVRRDLGMTIKEIARAMGRSKKWVEGRLTAHWKEHGRVRRSPKRKR